MEEICIAPHVYATFFEESAILLDSRKNVYYALNDSAAEFCKLLTKSGSFKEAMEGILNLYKGSSADVIKKEMEELVISLAATGLLEKGKSNT